MVAAAASPLDTRVEVKLGMISEVGVLREDHVL